MLERKPDFLDLPHQRQRDKALSRSESKGGAAPGCRQEGSIPGEVQTDVPPLTNAELVQLHIRVIALENLVIALLAEASDRQLELAREMAAYIAPRPGFTRHHLTVDGAAQMISLVRQSPTFPGHPMKHLRFHLPP
ncbi:hypothetical protein J7E62_32655 [Variovorax paradoxus]|nr:hypothetical protein [Variovorax paradoxus]